MAKLKFSDQQIADQLTRDGSYWYGNNADNLIKYSFSNDLGDFGSGTEYGVNNVQKFWINLALEQLADTFNIVFVEVIEPQNTTQNYPIDILQFVNDTNSGTYSQSWSYGSGRTAFSNIVLDQSWQSNQSSNLDFGSYGYMTILHENSSFSRFGTSWRVRCRKWRHDYLRLEC